MTGKPKDQGAPQRHHIVVLAYDKLWAFEFGIAAEIFGWDRPDIDVPWYDFSIASARKSFRMHNGLSVQVEHGITHLDTADTIIIPGWADVQTPPDTATIEHLIAAHERGARLVSFCTGAFCLAHAGLLSGKEATTHWRYKRQFQELFPDINIVEDVLYVDNGTIITSAGGSAAIDASLYMIRQDYGADISNRVARGLVTPPHRDGGQAQYVEAPIQERPGQHVAGVLDWARERLDTAITITDLAAQSGMSERTFLRRFRDSTGTTPLKWLRRERVYRAMQLLEKTPLDVADVALQSGFGSIDNFRASFKEIAGVPPGTYRKRFCTAIAAE